MRGCARHAHLTAIPTVGRVTQSHRCHNINGAYNAKSAGARTCQMAIPLIQEDLLAQHVIHESIVGVTGELVSTPLTLPINSCKTCFQLE